jgi:hypothetical protein
MLCIALQAGAAPAENGVEPPYSKGEPDWLKIPALDAGTRQASRSGAQMARPVR